MTYGSLVTWAAERLPTRQPMRIARITVDLMRPVPVAPLTIESEVVREGRKIQLCAVRLFADGVEVVRASILKLRAEAVALPAIVAGIKGADPKMTLQAICDRLETMRERTPRGRSKWEPSSVKMILERAKKLRLLY